MLLFFIFQFVICWPMMSVKSLKASWTNRNISGLMLINMITSNVSVNPFRLTMTLFLYNVSWNKWTNTAYKEKVDWFKSQVSLTNAFNNIIVKANVSQILLIAVSTMFIYVTPIIHILIYPYISFYHSELEPKV